MKILVALACAVLVGCGGGGSETSSTSSDPQPYVEPAPIPAPTTNELLAAVNEARASGRTCGTTPYPAAPPVTWDNGLAAAAYAHSLDMLTNNFLSVAPTGEAIIGTNTVNLPFAEDVVTAMLGSPTNCRAIMGSTFRAVGAGSAEGDGCRYVTFDFAE